MGWGFNYGAHYKHNLQCNWLYFYTEIRYKQITVSSIQYLPSQTEVDILLDIMILMENMFT